MVEKNELIDRVKYKYSFLAETIAENYPISEELKTEIRKQSFQISIKKGEFLVKEGEICTNMYFIIKGLTRCFVNKTNEEISIWFSVEQDWETAITSFFRGAPAIENIQALENCTIEGLSKKDIDYLCVHFSEVNIFIRNIFEEYYLGAEERAMMCRIGNASEKYKYFTEQRGDLINRVPFKYIASFLGMRLETLSRLRTKSPPRL